MTRIALIHALAHSVAPINDEMAQAWPEAQRMNLLDDSLSSDLAQRGQGLDAAMHRRFEVLADYAVGTGAQAILFTCSAFGPCIEGVARRHAGIPVLKPNEAMVQEAVDAGADIIMLDNMSLDMAKEAIEIIDHKATMEFSGNVSLENIKSIAHIGVDFISVGALTHSAKILDLSMKNLKNI